jgi:hypothetical protein
MPAALCLGRAETILKRREKIETKFIMMRCPLHGQTAA